MKDTLISNRKLDHIQINLEEDVQSGITTGLERYRFTHCALSELNMNEISTGISFLGKNLRSPLFISSMTGGTPAATQINRYLATAAEYAGIAMGVGSQRAALEDPSQIDSFNVRKYAPNSFLMANIGAIQLNHGYGLDECRKAVDMIQADALILHLNPIQEALQSEGNTDWKGLRGKIERVVRQIDVPVIVKEVGWGISGELAAIFAGMGVAAIDVAGAGGTSWSQVEMHRTTEKGQRTIASAFRNWGIPTAEAIQQVRAAAPHLPVLASGGIKDGVDVAKCIGLGGSLVGIAGRILKSATISEEETIATVDQVNRELVISMFAAGIDSISSLFLTTKLIKLT
jgi:isopentenyl-diphosphate delta-isomerase